MDILKLRHPTKKKEKKIHLSRLLLKVEKHNFVFNLIITRGVIFGTFINESLSF